MCGNKSGRGFALLFFPERSENTFVMQLSVPPPEWLAAEDLAGITITQPGMYCLFFLVASDARGRAFITVNGREIRGSYAEETEGAISGSAVCSIRDRALPCEFGIKTENGAGAGILLVFKYDV